MKTKIIPFFVAVLDMGVPKDNFSFTGTDIYFLILHVLLAHHIYFKTLY